MDSFQDLTQAITCQHHDKIKKACVPLFDYLNLCDFWYLNIKNSGHFSYFATHVAWTEYFALEKYYLISPFHRHPEALQAGVSFLRTIPDAPFLQSLDVGKDRFGINPCLLIIDKTPDGAICSGFSSNSSDQLQNAILLHNELPLLRLFIKKFREENRSLFSCLEDNQINLAELLSSAFYEEKAPLMPQLPEKQQILKRLGIKTTLLTSRETEVIKLLLEGYSASEIGKQIFLSKRTVEHHVERMKEKLGCDSKAELIQKARELEYYGLIGGRYEFL